MAFGKGGGKRDFTSGRSGGGFSAGRGGNRGGRSGGFGGSRGGGRDQRSFGGKGFQKGPVTMHKVTCDECESLCEVPFRPSSDKPVFCDSCFGGKRENKRGGSFGDKRSEPSSSGDNGEMKEMKKMLNELNMKLDVIIEFFNDELEEDALMPEEEEIVEAKPKAKAKKASSKKK
jgi:CxxC-x17-CxxC domain-containing protein